MKRKYIILIVVVIVILILIAVNAYANSAEQDSLTGDYQFPVDTTPLDMASGLFPNGSNTATATIAANVLKLSNEITPLDSNGDPSPSGKIGFLGLGASNSSMEWSKLISILTADPTLNPDVEIVNGCVGGVSIEDMNTGASAVGDYFAKAAGYCESEGITPEQVQAIWFKSDCLTHDMWDMTQDEYIDYFADQLTQVRQKIADTFPNCKVIYTAGRNHPYVTESSDTYLSHGGPRAYYNQLGIRKAIELQESDAKPVLTWMNPLYTDPLGTPNSYGHVWLESDVSGDKLHPTEQGKTKVANYLINFFKNDVNAVKWLFV